MSPDSPESRIGRLEQDVSAIKQRVQDHEIDIRAFAPMTASHAVLTEQIINLQKTQTAILVRLDQQDQARENAQREREAERLEEQKARVEGQERLRLERKSDRRWVVGTMVASAAFIVAAIGTMQGLF